MRNVPDDDLTAPPDLTRKHGAGPVRVRRPVYRDLLPPCNHACPAGENVQGWLALAQAGRFEEAWRAIVQDNPFPAVHGRVCYHPCESACNRDELDGAVSVHAVERWLGDRALDDGWRVRVDRPASGRRVLVVGAGPCGLAAAYHLALAGHAVEIRDAGRAPGGMMHVGIPAYRLPRAVLHAEIDRIRELGVRITLGHRVSDLEQEWRDGRFDAVLLALGAHVSKRTEIPARDAGRMIDAISFLRDVDAGAPPKLGRRVAVYGGGNTAMDAARTALRLGHEPLIIYRRDRAHMPAHDFEAAEAIEEGVQIHWLRAIASLEGHNVVVEEMELDDEGRPRPTGRFETIEADDLILALGQDVESEFLRRVDGLVVQRDGTIEVDEQSMTGRTGLFAGGDMVPADRSVTVAVGHGKRAARAIDAWLRGEIAIEPAQPRVAALEDLHLWFYTDAINQPQGRREMAKRRTSFAEVVQGLSAAEAAFEARRCLSCGTCFECDACYAACPEDAIVKLGPGLRYEHDYSRCTGCMVCLEQCPSNAIGEMPEPAGS